MNLSIHRIWYLFKMQWVENRKLYLLGLLALVGIIGVFFFGGNESQNSQSAFFMIGIFLSSSIFSSTLLSRFSEKTRAMSALLLPASAAEKTIVAIIYSMIIFPVVYFALVYPLMVAAHYYHSEMRGDLAPLWDMRTEVGSDLYVKLYFILQAFVLFCSAMFRRFTFIKTAVLVCIVTAGTVLLSEKIGGQLYKTHPQPKVLPKGFIPGPPTYATETETRAIYPRKGSNAAPEITTFPLRRVLIPGYNFSPLNSGPFMDVQFYANNSPKPATWQVVLPAWQQFLFLLLFYMTIPFFWLLTWLRLKEKTLI